MLRARVCTHLFSLPLSTAVRTQRTFVKLGPIKRKPFSFLEPVHFSLCPSLSPTMSSGSPPRLTLYGVPGSPPCRTVSLVLDVLNLDHAYKYVDLKNREQYSDAFLKLNPQHVVPVLEDGDFVLTESLAIAIYLAQKYDPEYKLGLLPRCPQQAATVHQRLLFDSGVLTLRFLKLFRMNCFGGKKEKPDEAERARIAEAMN